MEGSRSCVYGWIQTHWNYENEVAITINLLRWSWQRQRLTTTRISYGRVMMIIRQKCDRSAFESGKRRFSSYLCVCINSSSIRYYIISRAMTSRAVLVAQKQFALFSNGFNFLSFDRKWRGKYRFSLVRQLLIETGTLWGCLKKILCKISKGPPFSENALFKFYQFIVDIFISINRNTLCYTAIRLKMSNETFSSNIKPFLWIFG